MERDVDGSPQRGRSAVTGWPPGRRECTAAEVAEFLPADLRAVLAGLQGAPRPFAEATIQLLPFGSRSALEATDPPLAVPNRATAGDDEPRSLRLTEFGYDVMAEAAALVDADPDGVQELVDRAAAAADRIAQEKRCAGRGR